MQKYVDPMVTNYALAKDKALYKQRTEEAEASDGLQWNDVAAYNSTQTHKPASSFTMTAT